MKLLSSPLNIILGLLMMLSIFIYSSYGIPIGHRENALQSASRSDTQNIEIKHPVTHEARAAQVSFQPVDEALTSPKPNCCTRSDRENRKKIRKLKKELAKLNLCRPKRRLETCGLVGNSSSNVSRIQPSIPHHLLDIDGSNEPKTFTSATGETSFIDPKNDERLSKKGKKDKSRTSQHNLHRRAKARTPKLLDDKCLLAVEQYLFHYGIDQGKVQTLLGVHNSARLEAVAILKIAPDFNAIPIWDINKIAFELTKCSFAAKMRNKFKNERICKQIIAVIRDHYKVDDYWTFEDVVICKVDTRLKVKK